MGWCDADDDKNPHGDFDRLTMRRVIFLIHQYLGFTIGMYFIVLCATGAALILFENQIDGFRDFPVRHVSPTGATHSLATLLATVERNYPGEQPTHILLSCERGCTYDVSFARGAGDRLDVLVDPYSGKIVETVLWSKSIIGFLYDFHANLLAGDRGSTINSIIGLVAVLLFLTGMYLWPGWNRISRGFSVRFRAGMWRTNFDLHKLTGILCAAFFIFIVLTGVATVFLAEPPSAGAPATSSSGKTPLTLDALVAAADKALPGKITMIYPPADARSSLRIRKVVPGDPDPYGWSYVSVNQDSGKVTAVDDASKWPLAWRIYTYFYPLHIGSVGGFALRYVYVALACAPVLLYVTAFLMWLNRLRRDDAGPGGSLTKLGVMN
jgi:uncharacterized iron-regulated membrane protein